MNTTTKTLTEDDILSAIHWAIGRVRESHPPGTWRFPCDNYELSEHHAAMYSIGYTMTVCDDTVGGLRPPPDAGRLGQIAAGTWPYASMDYDARCGCCGAWAFAGCEDIYHGKEREAAAAIAAKIAAFEPQCRCPF